jgi:hypothetical protein
MTRAQGEFRLSCAVAAHLETVLPKGALWSHLPFGENRSEITGARLKRMGTQKGWPDYLVIYDGKFVGLELKTATGRVSPEQKAFGTAMIENGGDYFICRDLTDVDTALAMAGIPVRGRAA